MIAWASAQTRYCVWKRSGPLLFVVGTVATGVPLMYLVFSLTV